MTPAERPPTISRRPRLKRQYSSREVAALSGLTARQLQWWHRSGVLVPSVSPRRTSAGGFTERRYSPVDLLELFVLANLLRRGLSVQKVRRLIEQLRRDFGMRLFEAIGEGGRVRLLTDGRDIYARTQQGDLWNVFRAPGQRVLSLVADSDLRPLTTTPPRRRKRKRRRPRTSKT